MKQSISTSFDLLLSLESTSSQINLSFEIINGFINKVVVDNNQLAKFLILQDSFEWNITTRLLEWLSRAVIRLTKDKDSETILRQATTGLSLIQGLILLHRPSQRLFSQRVPFETLLYLLDRTHPAPTSSQSSSQPKATTSQQMSTPATPISKNETALALIILDTLLCALVDRPRNSRTFESVGGLKAVVKVLKDKLIAKEVRMKAIEILYYYLLPEKISKPPPYSMLLSPTLSDFIPQTPVRPRFSHRHHRSSSSSSSFTTPSTPSTPTSQRSGHERPKSRRSSDEEDGTPRATTRLDFAPSTLLQSAKVGRPGRPPSISHTPVRPTSQSRSPRPPSRSRLSKEEEEDQDDDDSDDETRTGSEKRELLQKLMGNFEALEERFEAMGLSFANG